MVEHLGALYLTRRYSMSIYKCYVYAYLNDNNEPYYIGKGTSDRAWKKHRNVHRPKENNKIVILENNLSDIGAFALERRYIKWYGRLDKNEGILLNRTDGGEGVGVGTKPWCTGLKPEILKWSDERKEKHSLHQKQIWTDQSKRDDLSNKWSEEKRKEHSKKLNNTWNEKGLCRNIETPFGIFTTTRECSKATGISRGTINYRCSAGIQGYKYLDNNMNGTI